jgi:flagellar protein FlaG
MSIPVTPADNSQGWVQMLTGRAAGTSPAEPARAPAEAVEEPTPVQVERAVEEVNASLEMRSVGLQFEIDKDTDKVIVKVIDRTSGEVIRQMPSEEVVRIAKLLGKVPGLLVSHGA